MHWTIFVQVSKLMLEKRHVFFRGKNVQHICPGLSRPLSMKFDAGDIHDRSMKVSWNPVPHASSYLLLVYDCSGIDRTVRASMNRNAEFHVLLIGRVEF